MFITVNVLIIILYIVFGFKVYCYTHIAHGQVISDSLQHIFLTIEIKNIKKRKKFLYAFKTIDQYLSKQMKKIK